MVKSPEEQRAEVERVARKRGLDLSVDEGGELVDTRTQAEKFAQAAREHGADQDEDAFKGVLRKLAKPKPAN